MGWRHVKNIINLGIWTYNSQHENELQAEIKGNSFLRKPLGSFCCLYGVFFF